MNAQDFLLEHNRYMNFIGIFFVLGLCYLLSKNRHQISKFFVLKALSLQFLIGFFVLRTKLGESFVNGLSNGIRVLYSYAEQGSAFVFGPLTDASQSWVLYFCFQSITNNFIFCSSDFNFILLGHNSEGCGPFK